MMALPLEYFPEPCQKPIAECSQCEQELYANDEVVVYDREIFCSSECVYDRVKEAIAHVSISETLDLI